MRLSIVIFVLVVSVCTASAQIMPPVTPLDMYAISNSAPARIATDRAGKIYVTDPYNGLVYIYTNSGVLSKTVRTVNYPIGVAVDSSGKIYISDTKSNDVGVFSDNGDLLYKFGKGNQEFKCPNDIAIFEKGDSRWAFVADSKANEIRKYSLDGTFITSFGSGLLGYPTGVAIDENAAELYVLDHNNVQIRIYDLNGNLLRSIAAAGGMFGGGKLSRPLGIAVDSSYIYIADAYYSIVAVYSKGGMFLKYIGNYGSKLGEFIIPSAVALDKDGKLFVTNTENQRFEVLGVGSFTGLKIEPGILDFKVISNGAPLTQNVEISSIGAETTWTVTTGVSWISVSPGSGSTPSITEVTVDPSGLSSGIYSTDVIFKTPSGTEYYLKVNAEVTYVAPALNVSPSSLSFTFNRKAETLPSETLMISSNGPALDWNASSNAGWLSLSKSSGMTPDSIKVSISEEARKMRPGQYNTLVTVNAGAVSGSPASINVSLEVIDAGIIKVRTNLEAASFTVTGTKTFYGSGTEFAFENAVAGMYTITFGHVSGYRKPFSKSFRVTTGNTVEVSGAYTQRPKATHLIAGSGDAGGNLLRAIPLNEGNELTVAPFDEQSVVHVAAGDMDGDGIDEIIVTNGKNIIKVYNTEGIQVAVKKFPVQYDRLDIAMADLNGDGKAEIIAGYILPGARITQIVALRLERGRIFVQRLIMRIRGVEPFSIASGDVNGDGHPDLTISQKSFIAAFDIQKRPALLWINGLEETASPNISAGDINDDGIDEILLASGPDQSNSPLVRILNGDGTEFGIEINALAGHNYTFGANAAAGVIDGEGTCSLAIGAGPGAENQALISLHNSGGQYLETIQAMDSLYGVNVGFGKLIK